MLQISNYYFTIYNININKDDVKVVFIFRPNLLNLPEKIVAGSEEVSYVYSATGQKLATKVGSSTTYYRGSFIYNDGELDHILHPEGIIRKATGAYVYYYAKKDHLGSTRVLCHEANGKMLADQTTDYYPFGLSHNSNGTNINRYLFSGKELQDQTVNGKSLMLYDFGARNYDPMLGRWFNIDPLAAKNASRSPYTYCFNSPVKYVDPDGRDGVVAIKGNQITVTANVYLYGAGATKTVLSQMQNDVNAKWGGVYSAQSANGTSFDVSIDINMALYGGKEQNQPILIQESWNPFNRDNFVEVDTNVKRSYVLGGDEGVWRSRGRNGMTLAQDDPAPHEVGHMLGLGDRYTDKNGANKGWEGNIMGESRTGYVDQRNIDGILRDAMQAYDTWIQDPKNKEKDFKYEINPNYPRN